MKGGGDAVSAARAVLQTGEYDFAWNLQVEDEILLRLEKGGKGGSSDHAGGGIEHIQLNSTDPWTEVDGERASLKTKHPTLSDTGGAPGAGAAGRQGLVEKFIYGRTGQATANFINYPGEVPLEDHQVRVQHRQGRRASREGRLEEGSRRRPREGRQEAEARLPDLDQPAAPEDPGDRQAGLPEGRHRDRGQGGRASVFFSSDVGQSRHRPHFYNDLQMYTRPMAQPIRRSSCVQFCRGKSRKRRTSGRAATSRAGRSKEYDELFKATTELDPVKRAAILIKCNEMVDRRPGRDPRRLPPRRRPA
jgi:peptide/nickel transport system substrate-binding protein